MQNLVREMKNWPDTADFLSYRRLLILISQTILIILTYYFSFLLRLDTDFSVEGKVLFLATLPMVLILKLPLFYRFGLLSGWWRYVGMSDLVDISKAAVTSSAALYVLLIYIRRPAGYPRSVLVIDMILTIFVVGGARFLVRAYTENVQKHAAQKNTLIVGAGRAGIAIVRDLKNNPTLDYKPIGFVDDDRSKQSVKFHGVRVLGTTLGLRRLIADYDVHSVLIAIPSANGKVVERIIRQCRECKVEFKILPTIQERIGRRAAVNQLRSVRVEDLLGRKPVNLDLETISAKLRGKVALITGAGGSIGSELARQVAQFGPQTLVLFERSENDLFKISNELAAKFPKLHFEGVVGDILDVTLLRQVFANFRPSSVFHAAAYKHVPMMERNCFQAVSNNIFGTYNVALVARQFHVEDFVMISSDKAVNPTNVMGVTKRVAEKIILGLQHHDTRYKSVRFGNVLNSNGSVLPIFQEQIAHGGPVTVTHPEAMRYFMTIPEAVQLVLQASTMGNGGEIFVLDMGKPVSILELARNLIRLNGFEPDVDIRIEFTGLRPGEKLFEELQLEGEGIKPTSHEKIRVLEGGEVEFAQVRAWLNELASLLDAKNVNGLISKLREIVPEYKPSEEILALCEVDRHDLVLTYKRAQAELWSPAQDAA